MNGTVLRRLLLCHCLTGFTFEVWGVEAFPFAFQILLLLASLCPWSVLSSCLYAAVRAALCSERSCLSIAWSCCMWVGVWSLLSSFTLVHRLPGASLLAVVHMGRASGPFFGFSVFWLTRSSILVSIAEGPAALIPTISWWFPLLFLPFLRLLISLIRS